MQLSKNDAKPITDFFKTFSNKKKITSVGLWQYCMYFETCRIVKQISPL